MIRTRAFVTAVALVCLTFVAAAVPNAVEGQERDRAKIDDKYKWNLADLYASDDAWRAAKDKLAPEIAKLAAFKGTLGTSPARLADALDTGNRVAQELQKVYLYASLISDQDTRISKYQGMQQEM
jgi:oligoendopeptidase F